jgi:hypothetical protein
MTDFEKSLRDQLRATETQLAPTIEVQLRAARQKAVARVGAFHLPRFLLPVTGMTLASIFALAILFSPQMSHFGDQKRNIASDGSVNQELDFYYWLAETQDVAGS